MALRYKILFSLFLFLGSNFLLKAQQFGGNLPSTQWRQINTDTARIIFPQGLDSVANRVAAFISNISQHNRLPLGNQLNKIDIVLQNQPVVTNGYVGLGPFRSEFYTTPSADNYDPSSLAWPTQLAVHEYRHVQQFNNFNNGLSAVIKKLFGQEGYALAINSAVPNWFFEGDAVLNETVFSPHGRGTFPFFLKAYPSLWQSQKKYSWMKLRNGSFKDYVPNHYDLGYLLVNFGVEKYGYDFWRKTTQDASAYKGFFYPMQKAIKRHSGLSYKIFIDSAFYYYKNIFKNEILPVSNDPEAVFPINTKTPTNYYFPYQLSPDSLLFLKSSYNKRPAFYIKNKTGETMIRFRDISIDEQYGYRNGKIVYAAYTSHPRWKLKSFSDLRLIDVKTGQQKKLSSKTRYFGPDISNDGKLVVANSVELDGSSSLIILNGENGAAIKKIKNNKVVYFSTPKIVDSNTVITVLRNKNATTQIAKINLTTEEIENITEPSKTIIGTIDAKEDKVYFTASQQLKDELYYYDLKTKQLFTTHTKGVGSYFLSTDFNKLSWSRFTARGYQLSQTNNNAISWQPVSMQQFTQQKSGIVAEVLEKETALSNEPIADYASKPYPKLSQPFNFHSWRPNYTDPEFSFTIYGNNILNTTETELYYLYNENNKTHTTGGSLVYGALFPFINIGTEYTFNRTAIISKKLKEWNEWNSYAGLSIPLSWASGNTFKSFKISSSYYYRSDFNKGENKNKFKELKFSYLAHGISWTQQVPSTVRDIYPRWGYGATTQFRHALSLYNSWQGYAAINLYMPGIFRSQNFVMNSAIQYNGTNQIVFGSRTAFTRGFAAIDSAGIFTARANYHLPLCYPDWGFANIFYLHRIRATVFYDYSLAFNKNADNKNAYKSTGAEIYFDTQWWNQHPLTFGVRFGKYISPIPDNKNLFFEFILPTSFIPR